MFTPNELREFMGYKSIKELDQINDSGSVEGEKPQDIIPPFWAEEQF